MKTLFASIIISFYSFQIHGQSLSPQVVSSSGNSASNANVWVDWTVGQIVNHSLTSPGFIVTQGFEQPSLLITSIEIPTIFEGVKVYPNPSSASVWVEFPNNLEGKTEIILTDVIGQTVIRTYREMGQNQIMIDVSSLSPASYFLKLCNPNTKSIASFKIIKIN